MNQAKPHVRVAQPAKVGLKGECLDFNSRSGAFNELANTLGRFVTFRPVVRDANNQTIRELEDHQRGHDLSIEPQSDLGGPTNLIGNHRRNLERPIAGEGDVEIQVRLAATHALSGLRDFVQDLLIQGRSEANPVSSVQCLKIRFDPLMVGHGSMYNPSGVEADHP
jgi:hypothetical protein